MDNKYTIICSKPRENATLTLTEDEYSDLKTMTVSKLREILESKQFITPDNDNTSWRFIFPLVESQSVKEEDRILGKASEKFVPLSTVTLPQSKEVILTNTEARVKPDLIGFLTNWFTGGKLRVQCSLSNNKDLQAINSNKFPPMMLTNVIATNKKLNIFYSNVCICCEDSAVNFKLRCWGSVGFVYEASLESGEIIASNAIHWTPKDYDLFGEATITAWGKDDRAIIMKAISNVAEIDPSTKLKYMKATFRARDLLAWRDNEKKITYNIKDKDKDKDKDKLKLKLKQANIMSSCLSNSVSANSIDQTIISGPDITPGTPTKGEKINVRYGNWNAVEAKPWENPEGTLDIYFFTFKSLEIAKKYFDKNNMRPLEEQEDIWEI